jgi:nucleoside-diphosphate-sugar epimerase
MKAFVTGGTGFVGGHLIDALLGSGATVTALARSSGRGSTIARPGVRLVSGDLSDVAALARAVAGHDVVFHAAGLIAARDEAEFFAVNRDGTRRVTEAAGAAGVSRFVLVSSLAVGGPSGGRPLEGPEPPRPMTRYGRSKLAGEEVVRASGLAWTIIRPPAVYGPADREMLRVFRGAALGLAPVFGDGSTRLSLVFAPDLARAIVAAGSTTQTAGGIYYAAHSEIVTSRELLLTLGRIAGRRVRIVSISRPLGALVLSLTEVAARLGGRPTVLSRDKLNEFFQPAWTCDPAPLTAACGWTAEHDWERGARATLEWYREHRWL